MSSIVARLAMVASRSLAHSQAVQQALPATSALTASLLKHTSSYQTSPTSWLSQPTATAGAVTTPEEKYAHLADKDIWDEAWAYEPRFGTEDNPIQVPALLNERIIGVTDPDDDTLVIWGIIREGEPLSSWWLAGEFFVLSKVDRVEKVGDKLNIPLAAPRAYDDDSDEEAEEEEEAEKAEDDKRSK